MWHININDQSIQSLFFLPNCCFYIYQYPSLYCSSSCLPESNFPTTKVLLHAKPILPHYVPIIFPFPAKLSFKPPHLNNSPK